MTDLANPIDAAKRRKIQRYFRGFPMWAIWLIGIGLIAVIGAGVAYSSMPDDSAPQKAQTDDWRRVSASSKNDRREMQPYIALTGAIGVIAVVVGAAVLLGFPKDRQIDAWLIEDLKYLRDKALYRLSLTEDDLVSDKEVMIYGPYRPFNFHHQHINLDAQLEVYVDTKQIYRKGRDGQARYAIVHLSIVFLTKNHLSAYSCIWDFPKGESLWEKTDEYFYQDVVSVSTETRRIKSEFSEAEKAQRKKEGKPEDEYFERERFRLLNSAATGIGVSLPDRELVKEWGKIKSSDVESNIRCIRKMLREKKA